MPIYEYQCQKCGHEFEREQRIVEDPIKKCPACKANRAKRLISKTSFVLKGGGWYNDLYSSAKPADRSGEAGGDAKAEPGEKSGATAEPGEKSGATAEPGEKSGAKADPARKSETKKPDAKSDSKKKGGTAKKSAA